LRVPTLSFRRLGALLATMLLVALPQLRAQGTATVLPGDLVYLDLDRLNELGFLDSVIVAQRPYSRREIGRIIRASRERSNRLGDRATDRRITDLELAIGDGILRRLETRFSREIDTVAITTPVAAVDDILLDVAYTDAERRGWFSPNTSRTEATIGSLLPRRLSTQLIPGTTLALESSQRLEPTSWLAFQLRERLDYVWAKTDSLNDGNAEILLGTVRARYRNIALDVGRDQFSWSQAADGGLFIANDAPALDQISLSTDQPFALPGILKWMGMAKAVVLVADLGPSQVRSYSRLLAYKVSVAPSQNAEIGAMFMNHFGGEDAPPASAVDRLIDFLPFVDIFRRHNYYDTTRPLDVESDKLLGIDGLFRVGGFRGAILAGELLIDDFDVHRLQQLFTGNGSQAFAVTFPRFISPLLSLKLTATHMGIGTYTHGQLTNGITTRGRLIGNELGPDAKAFGARLSWQPLSGFQLTLDGRSAIYSNATYASFYTDPDNSNFVVRKVARTNDEQRDRLGAIAIFQSDAGPAVTVRFVTERSRNYQFQGFRRTDSAAELAIHFLF
jgi:hypothetical protein